MAKRTNFVQFFFSQYLITTNLFWHKRRQMKRMGKSTEEREEKRIWYYSPSTYSYGILHRSSPTDSQSDMSWYVCYYRNKKNLSDLKLYVSYKLWINFTIRFIVLCKFNIYRLNPLSDYHITIKVKTFAWATYSPCKIQKSLTRQFSFKHIWYRDPSTLEGDYCCYHHCVLDICLCVRWIVKSEYAILFAWVLVVCCFLPFKKHT